jgi:hypothetical protein
MKAAKLKSLEEIQRCHDTQYELLVELMRSKKAPHSLRVAAGTKAVSICAAHGRFEDLVDFTNSLSLPREVRESAGKSLGSAFERVIAIYSEAAYLAGLVRLVYSPAPHGVKKNALDAIARVSLRIGAESEFYRILTEDDLDESLRLGFASALAGGLLERSSFMKLAELRDYYALPVSISRKLRSPFRWPSSFTSLRFWQK